nr:transposase [Streptomyces sp. H27-G5]
MHEHRVKYVLATKLVNELVEAADEKLLAKTIAPDAVLIADETGDIKKGIKSAGVARQYTGVTGQVENAQVSVHLSYGSSRGRAIIDRELYAGRYWAGDSEEHRRRCEEAGIPEDRARTVVTKPELARRMVERTLAAGVPFSYFLADELYGGSRSLRAWLEEHQVRYVLAIPKSEVLPLADGRTQEARQLWARVPEALMERRSCADGAKGPRAYDFATVHLADTPHGLARTLLIRRSTACAA